VPTSPELAIRLARAGFNRALASADLGAIGAVLAGGAILITGTDSAVLSGRKAQLQAWKREFAATDRTIYTRTPDSILPSPCALMALEQGAWTGVGATSGDVLASGRYSAKWRKIAGAWLIEGELYLTLG